MRLPDDYEDHGGGLTPTVISAIVAVTICVAVILCVVLSINRRPTSHQQNTSAAQTENTSLTGSNQTDVYKRQAEAWILCSLSTKPATDLCSATSSVGR